KEAAMALGLLSDDREHVLCLEEAVKLQTPSMIRYLFAFILSLGVTVRPVTLYDQFKGDMMADYFSPHPAVPLSAQEKEIRLFRDLTKLARKFSYEFADSGIQAPQGFTEEQIDAHINRAERSEERRVGKECRSRGAGGQCKKKRRTVRDNEGRY